MATVAQNVTAIAIPLIGVAVGYGLVFNFRGFRDFMLARSGEVKGGRIISLIVGAGMLSIGTFLLIVAIVAVATGSIPPPR